MSAVAAEEAPSIAARLQQEVERAIQRNLKGLEYLSSSGPAMGLTPRELLHRKGTYALYRYVPMEGEIYRIPVLIVMATTNRGYILDLAPGQSFVEFLLKQGYDVFVIDWDPPRPEEKRVGFDAYTQDFIPDAIRRVQKATGEEDVNLVGYCMGGVLSTVYLATHAKETPVKNLALFTTPVDFSGMKLFAKWSDKRHFDVDRLVDTMGNAPPEMILEAFNMLRPADRVTGNIRVWDNLWNDEFVKSYRMFDRWANDILPLPGEFFRFVTRELMQDNRLYRNELTVRGKRADLSAIRVPVLHALAEHDHIVPYDAARPLVASIGSKDKEEVVLKGGHVSVVAGANATKRLWPKLDQWLGKRST